MDSTINELLARDPLDMSDEDIDRLIRHFREERKKWHLSEAKPRKKKSGPDLKNMKLL